MMQIILKMKGQRASWKYRSYTFTPKWWISSLLKWYKTSSLLSRPTPFSSLVYFKLILSHQDLRNSKSKPPPARLPSNTVTVRDIQNLLPISRALGELYTYVLLYIILYFISVVNIFCPSSRLNGVGPGQATVLCLKNRTAALRVGRTDLAQLWTLIAHMTDPSLFPPFVPQALPGLSDSFRSLPPLSLREGQPSLSPSPSLLSSASSSSGFLHSKVGSRRRHTLTVKVHYYSQYH